MTSHRRALRVLATATFAFALLGCAQTNPPLMFGDTTTYGLRLGDDTASGGASVSLGYKAYSVALVPVSILNRDGHPAILQGSDDDGGNKGVQADAMSVFAAFDNTAGATASGTTAGAASGAAGSAGTVHIGQLFSTGLAAQTLTYAVCRKVESAACGDVPMPVADAASAAGGSGTGNARSRRRASSKFAAFGPNAGPASSDQPYQKPLLFMRSDVVGIDMGGSLAQEGLQFVLGYGNRNLALIPVAAMGADNEVVPIVGNDVEGDLRKLDTLSVMGQFNANSETAKLNVGMDRYFATGVAARNLSSAMLVTVAGAAASVPAAPASGAQQAVSTSNAVAGSRAGAATIDAARASLASR